MIKAIYRKFVTVFLQSDQFHTKSVKILTCIIIMISEPLNLIGPNLEKIEINMVTYWIEHGGSYAIPKKQAYLKTLLKRVGQSEGMILTNLLI